MWSKLNQSRIMGPHERHTPIMEQTENQIYAYAITCSALEQESYIPGWLRQLNQYTLPIIILSAFLGNILVCIFMATLAFRRLSVCLYVAGIAVIDSTMLLIRASDLWLQSISGIHLTNTILISSKAFCTTFPLFYNFLIHMKSLLHIAIAVDVFLLFWRPVFYWQALTPERVRNSCIFFSAVLLTINCQFLWTYDIVRVSMKESIPKGEYCTYSIKWVERRFRDIIWPIIDFTIGEILPILVVVACFFLCINQARKLSDNQDIKIKMSHYIIDVPTFLSLRRTVLLQNILYTLALLPEIIYYLIKYNTYINTKLLYDKRRIALPRVKPERTLFEEMLSSFVYSEAALYYCIYLFQCFKFPIFYVCCQYFRQIFSVWRFRHRLTINRENLLDVTI